MVVGGKTETLWASLHSNPNLISHCMSTAVKLFGMCARSKRIDNRQYLKPFIKGYMNTYSLFGSDEAIITISEFDLAAHEVQLLSHYI